jgi:hypothetical protein
MARRIAQAACELVEFIGRVCCWIKGMAEPFKVVVRAMWYYTTIIAAVTCVPRAGGKIGITFTSRLAFRPNKTAQPGDSNEDRFVGEPDFRSSARWWLTVDRALGTQTI